MNTKDKIEAFLKWLDNVRLIELVEFLNEYGNEGEIKKRFEIHEIMELYIEFLEERAFDK